jgi:cell division septation protein DedD
LAADQRAFERRRRTDNGELVIVLVGPVTTRQAAQSLLSTIAEQEGIEGLVKPFELGSLD